MVGRGIDLLLRTRHGVGQAQNLEAHMSDHPEVPRIEFNDDPDPSVFECEHCGETFDLDRQSTVEFVCLACKPG